MPDASPYRAPLPRLAFRLGFTGHRRGPRLHWTDEELGGAVSLVLQAIGDGLRECGKDAWSYDHAQTPELRMLNAVATGADTIAAHAAQAAGCLLECVLPFTRQDYLLQDFPAPGDRMACERILDHPQTVSVFSLAMKRGKQIDWRGYRAAGEVIAGNCDLLLAVWDGQDSGQLGGAEDVIRMAIEQEVPVLAIGADPGQPMRLLLDDTLGSGIDCAAIRSLVTGLVTPPSAATHAPGADAGVARERYFTEDRRGGAARLGRLLPWHRSARALALFAKLFSADRTHLKPLDLVMPAGAAADVEEANTIAAHFAAADTISTKMGYVYRSSFTILYLLSALAVLTGLLGVFRSDDMVLKAWLVLAELVILAAIIILFATGRQQRWHHRWLDTRRVSEALRAVKAAVPLAGGGQRGGGAAAATDWTEWYVRAVLRENRLPARVTASPPYLHAEIGRFVTGLLDGQIGYHWATARNMARLHEGLDRLGMGLLLASAGIGAAYVAAVFLHLADTHDHSGFFAEWFKPFVTYAAAGFPALGAALYGIRAHGDYEATAERSADTLRELLEVRRSLLLLDAKAEPGFTEVRAEFSWAAEVMQSDLTLWRSLYRNRPLTMLA